MLRRVRLAVQAAQAVRGRPTPSSPVSVAAEAVLTSRRALAVTANAHPVATVDRVRSVHPAATVATATAHPVDPQVTAHLVAGELKGLFPFAS